MQHHVARAAKPPAALRRPYWSAVLRALREARGVTQEGWAAQLGFSRRTVRRWEAGEAVPDAAAEAALIALCREKALFDAYHEGPLAGVALTEEWLRQLLTAARLGRLDDAPAVHAASAPVDGGQPDRGDRSDASTDSAHGNLPHALTRFIGRERDVAEVVRRLSAPVEQPNATRLLSLVGTGGIGKTRLALAAAHALAPGFGHDTWLVELAPVADPALVPRAIAQSTGVRIQPDEAPMVALAAHFRRRRALLVLDNCEHVISASARAAESLLRDCAELRILATSREPLAITGETIWRVPVLSLPETVGGNTAMDEGSLDALMTAEAVRLFVERARAVQPEWTLSTANAAAVAHICRSLDGLPLALELAAARLRTLTVQHIAARIDARLSLLSAGSRVAEPRQQTLRATIDWSHDLLTEPERIAFRRLAVFARGCTAEAARAVCGDAHTLRDDDVTDRLIQLVDKSLVIVDHEAGTARYRMLDTIREYAVERLADAGETEVVQGRHLQWFLVLAESARREGSGPAQGAWFDRLEQDHHNLRAALRAAVSGPEPVHALRLAVGLARFWLVRGYIAEGATWFETAIDAGERAPEVLRATALRLAGDLEFRRGDPSRAMARFLESLDILRRLDDRVGIAGALTAIGYAMAQRGEHLQAMARFRESLAMYRELSDLPGTATALLNLGLSLTADGAHTAARDSLAESLKLWQRLSNPRGIANALESLGRVEVNCGELERARSLLCESLALFRDLRDPSGIAGCLRGLAAVTAAEGNAARAVRLLGGVDAVCRTHALAVLPIDRELQQRVMASARDRIGDHDILAEEWAIGRALSVDELLQPEAGTRPAGCESTGSEAQGRVRS